MLTPQESDDLTFRADHPTWIKKMIEVLKNIGMDQ